MIITEAAIDEFIYEVYPLYGGRIEIYDDDGFYHGTYEVEGNSIFATYLMSNTRTKIGHLITREDHDNKK